MDREFIDRKRRTKCGNWDRTTKDIVKPYDVVALSKIIDQHFRKRMLNLDEFMRLGYCFVHFNYYGISNNFMFLPAEYALAKWSLNTGVYKIMGEPIDTLNTLNEEINPSGCLRSTILGLPRPNYTYKMGLAYAQGTDDYKSILDSIDKNASSIGGGNGEKWKYVFTAEADLDAVRGCMAWLMDKSNVNLRIRVYPIEKLLASLFRACATSRKINEQIAQFSETNNGINVPKELCDLKLSDEDLVYVEQKASNQNIKISVMGPVNIGMPNWDYKLELGCFWHQLHMNAGGINKCSTMLVKKWAYLTLSETLFILNQDPGTKLAELKACVSTHMRPRPWTEQDAAGIEACHRFGIKTIRNVNEKRREILENAFVFPKLFEILKKKYPRGLPQVPKTIIWPVNRDIETDLNWANATTTYIQDPNPNETLRKRQLKRKRDENDNDEWGPPSTHYKN